MKDNNKNVVNETTNEEVENTTNNVSESEITLDELLKDPKIQAEFDKKAEGMRQKWEKAWQKKSEEEKLEAEKLARMTEEEKHQLQLNKAIEEKDRAQSELNAYKLKDEAIKIANEKQLDVGLLDVIDFNKETAETVKAKIDEIDSSFKKAVEKKVNDMMKQPSPKQVSTNTKTDNKNYLDAKYKNNPFYKG